MTGQFLVAVRNRLRDSARAAGSRAYAPTAGRAASLYAFTLLYCLLWATLGLQARPDLFFDEGGPVDWLSTTYFTAAAILAWIGWSRVRGSGEPSSWFWLASAGGFAFFAVDERFQLHERFDWQWIKPIYGPAPWGFRNWNDMAVLGYGVIALILLAAALPGILRHRRTFWFLMIALVCAGLHTLTDTLFQRSPAKESIEETFKLFAGASFVLAYLHVALADVKKSPRRSFTPQAAFVLGLTLILVGLMFSGGDSWRGALTRKWGPPDSWLASVYLGSAALLCWFSWLPARKGAPGGRLTLCASAVALGWLAFDESTVAGWRIFHHTKAPCRVAELLDGQWAFLHNLPTASAIAVALGALLLLAKWRSKILRQKEAAAFLGVGTACLVVAVVMRAVPDDRLPAVLEPVFRATFCASVVLTSMVLFLANSSATPGSEPSQTWRSRAGAFACVVVLSLLAAGVRVKQTGVDVFARHTGDGFGGSNPSEIAEPEGVRLDAALRR